VVGRDWASIDVAEGTLTGAKKLAYADHALWTLRPDESGTDRLLRSADAVTWEEVPLDPRMPTDTAFIGRLHVVSDRLIVTHIPETATMNVTPAYWVALRDGSEWAFIGPDELGSPTLQVSHDYLLRSFAAVESLGDDLVFLVSADIFAEGSTTGCACFSPLVLRADGTVDWSLTEGSPIADPKTWDGSASLISHDDGLLLAATWKHLDDSEDVLPRLLHSRDGITWEERPTSADQAFDGVSFRAPILHRGDTWVAAATVRYAAPSTDDPDRTQGAIYTSQDHGETWTLAQLMDESEIRPGPAVLTDSGFYVFPYPYHVGHEGTTVYFSDDGTDWIAYPEALSDRTSYSADVLFVEDAVAIGDGIVALTSHKQKPLWVSGPMPFALQTDE